MKFTVASDDIMSVGEQGTRPTVKYASTRLTFIKHGFTSFPARSCSGTLQAAGRSSKRKPALKQEKEGHYVEEEKRSL